MAIPHVATIHWIVFMVAGFCVLFLLFSSMDKQKEKITGKTSAGKSEESEEEESLKVIYCLPPTKPFFVYRPRNWV